MGGVSGHGQRNKAHKAGRHAGKSAREKHSKSKGVRGGKEESRVAECSPKAPKRPSHSFFVVDGCRRRRRQRLRLKLNPASPTETVPMTEAGPARASIRTAPGRQGKAQRLQASKAMREKKKAEILASRRAAAAAPRVVGVLPLSASAAASSSGAVWRALVGACLGVGGSGKGGGKDAMDTESSAALALGPEGGPVLLPLPGSGGAPSSPAPRLLLLPPLRAASGGPPNGASFDPLAVVDLVRASDVLLLVADASSDAEPLVDAAGEGALSVARALGAPLAVGVAVLPLAQKGNDLKSRAAAKKRLSAALERHLPGREPRISIVNDRNGGEDSSSSSSDASSLARTIADANAPPPPWRRQRPSLLVEAASHDETSLELTLRCHVRGGAGLSAASLVHVPGCGDFQVERILAAPGPRCGRVGADGEKGGATGGESPAVVLASVPASERETLEREAAPAAAAVGDQFPAVDDMAAVEYALAAAEAGVAERERERRGRLPAGTSDYQAAWLLDDDDESGDDEDDDGDDLDGEFGGGDSSAPPRLTPITPLPPSLQRKVDAAVARDRGGGGDEAWGSSDDEREGDGAASTLAGTFRGSDDDDDDGDEDDALGEDDDDQRQLEESSTLKQAWRDQAEDARFPDEIDTPVGVPARLRFSKYRALKSWRSSRWDPSDGAPAEFARVFAFEAPKRARRRAVALAASAGTEGNPGVPSGARVDVVLRGVPASAAASLVAAVGASTGGSSSYPTPPVVATGLLQHEGRLSVMHWAIRKSTSYEQPIKNKQPLLFVDGVRRFLARPLFSGDDHGASQFKLERFLQPGRACVATCYAPIAHGPLPLLAFSSEGGEEADGGDGGEGRRWRLAATGGVRGADPDRVILKKVVLSGYPVKVHKRKAVVRWMFHEPADVRWFRPVELWSKGGRRGRIREPVGTHGAMKCVFDGQMSQADGVCMSLYKRAAPKWPPGDVWTG